MPIPIMKWIVLNDDSGFLIPLEIRKVVINKNEMLAPVMKWAGNSRIRALSK